MLQKLADILEVDVKQLLGAEIEMEQDRNELAEQLARINEQMAIKNRRSRTIWKVIGWLVAIIILLNILLVTFFSVDFGSFNEGTTPVNQSQEQRIDE